MSNTPQFGIFLDPSTDNPDETFRLAAAADDSGLDLLTVQDHPYQQRHFENWTLLTALAMKTNRIRVAANVGNLPLRLPAMIAKQAATLDVLTGGRVELGLGAGGFWDAIAAFGGTKRAPGEAYAAFEDALVIIRGLWESAGRAVTYQGSVYSVKGAKFGPAPVHNIPIWVGARGPKMLRLTGRVADGLIISMLYVPPSQLAEVNALLDEGAAQAERSPVAVRRGYNVPGLITAGENNAGEVGQQGITGTAAYWVDALLRLYDEHRQDTFILWGNDAAQVQRFGQEVAPQVKARLGIAV